MTFTLDYASHNHQKLEGLQPFQGPGEEWPPYNKAKNLSCSGTSKAASDCRDFRPLPNTQTLWHLASSAWQMRITIIKVQIVSLSLQLLTCKVTVPQRNRSLLDVLELPGSS